MTTRADTLRERASDLRRQADRLIQDAKNIEERQRAREQYEARKRLIYRYAMEAAKGRDVLSDMMASLTEGDAKALLRQAESSYRHIATARRDREICRLAWNHSNADIGERFDLHPNTVSRIVSKHVRGWLHVK